MDTKELRDRAAKVATPGTFPLLDDLFSALAAARTEVEEANAALDEAGEPREDGVDPLSLASRIRNLAVDRDDANANVDDKHGRLLQAEQDHADDFARLTAEVARLTAAQGRTATTMMARMVANRLDKIAHDDGSVGRTLEEAYACLYALAEQVDTLTAQVAGHAEQLTAVSLALMDAGGLNVTTQSHADAVRELVRQRDEWREVGEGNISDLHKESCAHDRTLQQLLDAKAPAKPTDECHICHGDNATQQICSRCKPATPTPAQREGKVVAHEPAASEPQATDSGEEEPHA